MGRYTGFAMGSVAIFAIMASAGLSSAQEAFDFSIERGPLAAVITTIAATAGTTAAIPSDLAKGRLAGPIRGKMSVAQAIDAALAGTGLTAVSAGSGYAIVKGADSAAPAGSAAALDGDIPAIEVTDDGKAAYADTGFKPGNAGDTARIADAPLKEVPLPIGVITKDVIAAQGLSNPLAAARYVAGVVSTGDGFTIRGFQGFGTDVNNVSYGGTRGGIAPSGFGTERVEVLKGPTSILTGVSTEGGLINVVPKTASGEERKEVQVELGQSFRRTLGLDFGGVVEGADDFSYRFVGSGLLTDDKRDHDIYLSPSLRWANDVASVTAYLRRTDNDDRITGRSQYFFLDDKGRLDSIKSDTTIRIPGANRRKSEGTEVGSEQTYDLGAIGELGTLTFQNKIDYSNSSTFSNTATLDSNFGAQPGKKQHLSLTRERSHLEALTERPSLTLKSDFGNFAQNNLTIGYDYSKTTSRDSRSQGLFNNDPFGGLFDISTGKVLTPYTFEPWSAAQPFTLIDNAVYAIDKIDLLDTRLHVTGSVRNDQWDRIITDSDGVSTTKISGLSYVTGAVFDLTPYLSPYVNYSNGFVPNNADPATHHFPPPQGRTLREAGVKAFMFDDALTLTGSVYSLSQTNVSINTAPFPNPPHYILVSNIETRGAELQLQGAITPDWLITASLAKTLATIPKGTGSDFDPTAGVPEWTGTIWSTYGFDLESGGRLTLGGGMRAVSSSRTIYQPQASPDHKTIFDLPGYAIFDASATLEKNDWRLQFNLSNIFDKEATVPGAHAQALNLEQPRTFKVTLSKTF